MDYVVRTGYSEELEKRIEGKSLESRELSEIRDVFYRQEDVELGEFSPQEVIVRKRVFTDGETLKKINIIDKPLGYSDTKEEVEDLEGFEKWGDFTATAVEHDIKIGKNSFNILVENFSFGKYVKIEAGSVNALREAISQLGVDKNDLIEKNSAQLLAQKRNLI